MKLFFWFFALASIISFTACENGTDAGDTEMDGDTTIVDRDEMSENMLDDGELRVYPMENYQEVNNVTLRLTSPERNAQIQPGNVRFNYQVENFELGKQTEDAQNIGIANSGDGQHLHVILNNEPYMAHYEPTFQKDLSAGKYVLLTFPSRSYHLSVKDRNAMVLQNFRVGNANTGDSINVDQPHLFYSRPKGEYTGNDAQRIMLDFYLVNTDLSDGHYVVAEINGSSMKITNWQPYIMEGLPNGSNTIRLTLYDGDDQVVESPYNPVERSITVGGTATAGAGMQH